MAFSKLRGIGLLVTLSATAAVSAAAPVRGAHPATAPVGGWTGQFQDHYKGPRERFLDVEISPRGHGFRVRLDVTTQQCQGRVIGQGTIRHGVLEFISPKGAQGDLCRLSIRGEGSGVRVFERSCFDRHGAGCDYDGVAARVHKSTGGHRG